MSNVIIFLLDGYKKNTKGQHCAQHLMNMITSGQRQGNYEYIIDVKGFLRFTVQVVTL